MTYDMEMQGFWLKASPEELRAEEAVVNYMANCDYYDRRVCGEDGIPKSAEQRGRINRHAIETRDRLIEEHRITHAEFQKEIQRQSKIAKRPHSPSS